MTDPADATVAPAPAPPTAPYAGPASAPGASTSRPVGGAVGYAALIGAAVLTLLYFLVKVLAAVLNAQPDAFDPGSPVSIAAAAFGVLGILSIVVIAGVIVVGHLGLRTRADGSTRGRVAAAIGLGAGYVHLVAWLTRLIVAVIVAAQYGDLSTFLADIFWWA